MSAAISAVFQALCSPFSPRRHGGNHDITNHDEGNVESGSGNDNEDGDPSDSNSTAISAVYQALCSPFSPRHRGGNHDITNEGNVESGSGNDNEGGDHPSDSDSIDVINEDSTEMETTTRKRKRVEKPTTTMWGTLTTKAKKEMKQDELCQYFQTHLEKIECSNKKCNCLHVLKTVQVRRLVAEYIVWFERKRKYDQDSILLDWYRYAHSGKGHTKLFMLPFNSVTEDESTTADTVIQDMREARLCSDGIRKVMMMGKTRWSTLRSASTTTGIMPVHKHTGRIAPNAVADEKRTKALKDHFDTLLCLGEVRATRVIATLVDGEKGHANREDTTDMVYLPVSFGFCPCYKRYMEALGYDVSCRPNGGIIVRGVDGKGVDSTEFVSFATYCRKWKTDYPQLKVSKPVEDICQYCFVFANRHRYLANHSSMEVCVECDDDGDDIDVVRPAALANDTDIGGGGGHGMRPDPDINAECIDTTTRAAEFINASVRPAGAECASTTVQEEREILLLECADHIKMARAQRLLYQLKIELAIKDARLGTIHIKRTYTFVVDFGQNMELPVFNTQQPGCTYYYSPLSVYNLGVVDHGHKDAKTGEVGAHMYAHVYHEGVGKKGANNVASLIVKTLRLLNLLQEDSPGEELNIIFDNCSGQNKNNTVLKLAAWLKAMGYFKWVNFIFLIVGHTKNAANRLFNSLKHEYRKKNIYTMEGLVDSLGKSDSVTVLPTEPSDFFDYDKLFKGLFQDMSGRVKKNHIFSCSADDWMDLCESNIPEHSKRKHKHKLWKRGQLRNAADLKKWSSEELKNVECMGLNPYKMVELWRNYRPQIPKKYRRNILYRKPDERALSVVKEEKVERSVFRKKLKEAKAAGMKGRLESIAYFDDDGFMALADNDNSEREVNDGEVDNSAAREE